MLKFSVRGVDEWRRKFATLSKEHKRIVDQASAEYVAGIEGGTEGGAWHGAAHYTPYQYVSMKQAYGDDIWVTMSPRQRGFIFANMRDGKIEPGVPHRTGELQRGWYVRDQGSFFTAQNDAPYAPFLHGNNSQTEMARLGGWKKISSIIDSNIKGAVRHASAKLKEFMKGLGM